MDASVLVSAAVAFPDSPSARVLDAVRAGRLELIMCDQLLGEVDRALRTRYFAARITDQERASIALLLRTLAVVMPDPAHPPPVLETVATTTSWSWQARPVPR
ncbi:MAG: PIN domain-containing protein [Trebonia sp.]